MGKWFDMLNSVSDEITAENVQKTRIARGCSIREAKDAEKASALYGTFSDMRYRLGEFEGASDSEVLDALLDMLMAATKINQ